MHRVSLDIPEAVHREMKSAAAIEGKTLGAASVEAFGQWIAAVRERRRQERARVAAQAAVRGEA